MLVCQDCICETYAERLRTCPGLLATALGFMPLWGYELSNWKGFNLYLECTYGLT